MPINIENALTFTTGSILGFLVGRYIDHLLARSRNIESIQIVEFNKAATTFRAAFVEAIFALRNNAKYGTKRAGDIVMESVVVDHERAKIMFEPFVPDSKLKSFNDAWEKYRYSKRNQAEDQDNESSRKKLSQIYLEHIDALLKYANAKSGT